MDISEISKRIIDNPLETDWLDHETLTKFLNEMVLSLSERPNIARVQGRTIFSGDIHGDIQSMLAAIQIAEKHDAKIVFLGDIIDRGSHNVECVNLILAHIYQQPDRFFYTRGNHEFQTVNSRWGFKEAVLEKYPEEVFQLYNKLFEKLPLAALQNNKVYGIHGGISSHAKTLEKIEAIEHENINHRHENIDLLWNDPSIEPLNGFQDNKKRKIFYFFGQDVFDEFMDINGLELFIRGHNKQKAGYRYFFNNRLISIFTSADHYKDTKPSVVLVEDDGSHEIIVL
jgi:diadenosine tetraphosphatase ApaH/serine/threonine PP2A family protein phosphatase